MAAVFVWTLIVATLVLGVLATWALVITLRGLWRQLRGDK